LRYVLSLNSFSSIAIRVHLNDKIEQKKWLEVIIQILYDEVTKSKCVTDSSFTPSDKTCLFFESVTQRALYRDRYSPEMNGNLGKIKLFLE
jgi:hypothetical protein